MPGLATTCSKNANRPPGFSTRLISESTERGIFDRAEHERAQHGVDAVVVERDVLGHALDHPRLAGEAPRPRPQPAQGVVVGLEADPRDVVRQVVEVGAGARTDLEHHAAHGGDDGDLERLGVDRRSTQLVSQQLAVDLPRAGVHGRRLRE